MVFEQLYVPNTKRLQKVHEHVERVLTENPNTQDLLYHGPAHTLDPKLGVVAMTANYAREERLNAQKTELGIVAAYLHDVGFIKQYSANEALGAEYARIILPSFGYTRSEIDVVEGIIPWTDPSKGRPDSHLAQVVCDADTDNLGRYDFIEKMQRLGAELKITDLTQWYNGTLHFMTNIHAFHTETARRLREPAKQQNIADLAYLLEQRKAA